MTFADLPVGARFRWTVTHDATIPDGVWLKTILTRAHPIEDGPRGPWFYVDPWEPVEVVEETK